MSKRKMVLICLLTGWAGGHYFAIGKVGKGGLYLFTFGLFGFGWLIDLLTILDVNDFEDFLKRKEQMSRQRYQHQPPRRYVQPSNYKNGYINIKCTELNGKNECPSDFAVLDFETTGLEPDKAKIIQVAAMSYRNFEKVAEYITLVNPETSIPRRITELTGIA